MTTFSKLIRYAGTALLALTLATGALAQLQVETGQFAADTADAVTTVASGFQGKAIILFSTGRTVNGEEVAANASWSIGFSDGTNHRTIAWAGDDNVGDTNVGKEWSVTEALQLFSNGTPTALRSITGVTFGATTVTITWDGTPAAAYLVGYKLLGGADITNVLVGTANLANSTGDKSETGVGFQGNFGIFIYTSQTAAGTAVRANAALGFAVSQAKQFGMTGGVDDAQAMASNFDAVSYTNNANFLNYILDGAETIDVQASFGTAGNPTGWTSNGFDYNISNAHATNATQMGYLIIKGGQWDVGTNTLPTASNAKAISTAFQPTGVFVASSEPTANATVTIHAVTQVGVATSTSTEASSQAQHSDTGDPTLVQMHTSNTQIVDSVNLAASVGVIIDFTSFDATPSFTLTGNSSGPAAPQFGWFAMADNASPPTSSGAGWWGPSGFFKLETKGWARCGFLQC